MTHLQVEGGSQDNPSWPEEKYMIIKNNFDDQVFNSQRKTSTVTYTGTLS